MPPRAPSIADGFTLAAMCFYVGALLHLAVIVMSMGDWLLPMLPAALFWGVLATALLRRIRVLAWIAYFAALGTGLFALGYGVPVRGVDNVVLLMIAAVTWAGAVVLLVHLWRYRGAFRRA